MVEARIMPRFSVNAVKLKTQIPSISPAPTGFWVDYCWGPGGSIRVDADLAKTMVFPTASEILKDNPEFLVRFEELSGSFTDSSANGRTITTTGTPTRGVSSPVVGYGITQDGSQSHSVNYTPTNLTGSSVEVWFRATGSGFYYFNQGRNGGNGCGLTLAIGQNAWGSSAGQLDAFVTANSVWVGIHTLGTYNDGWWHHAVATWYTPSGSLVSSSDFTIYVDGVRVSTVADRQAEIPTSPLTGTGNMTLLVNSFVGSADELAFYSYALSAERVLAHYQAWYGIAVNAMISSGHFTVDGIKGPGNPPLRVSMVGVEVARVGNPNARESLAGLEVALRDILANLVVSEVGIEAARTALYPEVDITQFGIERALQGNPYAVFALTGIEVVRSGVGSVVASLAGLEIVIEKPNGSPFLNANIYRPGSLMPPTTFTVGATLSLATKVDAVIFAVMPGSFHARASFIVNIEGHFHLDAEVQLGFLANAVIIARLEKLFYLYARTVVVAARAGLFTVGAWKHAPYSFVASSVTLAPKSGSFTVGASMIIAGQPIRSMALDATVRAETNRDFLLEAFIYAERTVIYEGTGSTRVVRNLITDRLQFPGCANPIVPQGNLAADDVNNLYGPFRPIDFTPVTLTLFSFPDYDGSRSFGIHSYNTNAWVWPTGPGITYTFWPSYFFEDHYVYTWRDGVPFDPTLQGDGVISFYRDDVVVDALPAPTIDAWLVGSLGEPFTLDAELVGGEKTGSFTVGADLKKVGEQRGHFWADAHLLAPVSAFFSVGAVLRDKGFLVDALIHQPHMTLDAHIHNAGGGDGSFGLDAVRLGSRSNHFHVDAYKFRPRKSGSTTIDADISPTGEKRGTIHLDAVLLANRVPPRFYAVALLSPAPSLFTVNAVIAGWFLLDALIVTESGGKGIFTVGAYIRGSSYIIFPDNGGDPTDPFGNPPGVARKFSIKIEAGFSSPQTSNQAEINRLLALIMEAEDDLASLTCIPEAERLPVEVEEIKRLREYIADLKEQLAAAKAADPAHKYWDAMARMQYLINIYLAIPSNQRTPAQKAALAIDQKQLAYDTMQYRIARDPKRTWVDITGDVIWSGTEFSQQARTGPGSFTITLKGAQVDFKGGEEIHFEIDDLRVFGGWVTDVQKDSFFADVEEPRTVLHGTDYNILFDRLVIRNYPWELANYYATGDNMGPYQSWKPYKQYTMDDVMIRHAFRNYIAPDLPPEFNWEDEVDAITTPAPVSPWVMPEAGSTLRSFMQSISMITTGIWYIDPYMVLHYHERGKITAPYPLTDGLGGISSRGLRVATDISSMINDVIMWGTLAKTVDGEIIVWHEIGDGKWWERRYLAAIEHDQKVLAMLLAIPASERTDWQDEAIVRYRAAIALYKQRLAEVRANAWDPDSGLPRPANAQIDSIGHWGRWQHGEFREDIHHQEWLNRRGHSILVRYDEPIVKATATVWDPGYQAGQVVTVKSSVYGVNVDLVIRALKISFTVPKEPVGDVYYALPQYDLEMGIDPESPWNIYDFLPFPGQGTPGLRMDTTGGL